MMDIIAVEQVLYPSGVDGRPADVIGFNFTYEDQTVYELGPVLLPQELLAIMRMAVALHEMEGEDGSYDTDVQE